MVCKGGREDATGIGIQSIPSSAIWKQWHVQSLPVLWTQLLPCSVDWTCCLSLGPDLTLCFTPDNDFSISPASSAHSWCLYSLCGWGRQRNLGTGAEGYSLNKYPTLTLVYILCAVCYVMLCQGDLICRGMCTERFVFLPTHDFGLWISRACVQRKHTNQPTTTRLEQHIQRSRIRKSWSHLILNDSLIKQSPSSSGAVWEWVGGSEYCFRLSVVYYHVRLFYYYPYLSDMARLFQGRRLLKGIF